MMIDPRAAYIVAGLLLAAKRPGVRVDQIFAMGRLASRWELGQLEPTDEALSRAIWDAAMLEVLWPDDSPDWQGEQ